MAFNITINNWEEEKTTTIQRKSKKFKRKEIFKKNYRFFEKYYINKYKNIFIENVKNIL